MFKLILLSALLASTSLMAAPLNVIGKVLSHPEVKAVIGNDDVVEFKDLGSQRRYEFYIKAHSTRGTYTLVRQINVYGEPTSRGIKNIQVYSR